MLIETGPIIFTRVGTALIGVMQQARIGAASVAEQRTHVADGLAGVRRPTERDDEMSSVQMKYAICLALSAFPAVGLMCDAAPTATRMRGADVSWAAGEVPRSRAEWLDA